MGPRVHPKSSKTNLGRRGAAALAAVGAGSLAVAGRAWTKSRASRQRLEMLNEIAVVGDGSSPLSVTMKRISDVVVPLFADVCTIDTIQEGRATRLTAKLHERLPGELHGPLMANEPMIPDALLNAEPGERPRPVLSTHKEILGPDWVRNVSDRALIAGLEPNSAITAPLFARGRLIGSISLLRCGRRHAFAASDIQFVATLSGRIALALDNAGLFSDLQSVEQRMDTVMDVMDEAVVIHDRGANPVFANRASFTLFGTGERQSLADLADPLLRNRFRFYDEFGAPVDEGRLPFAQALAGQPPEPLTLRMINREDGNEKWVRAKSRIVGESEDEAFYVVTVFEDVSDLQRRDLEQTLLAEAGRLLESADSYEQTLSALVDVPVPRLSDWCAVYLPGDENLELAAIAHSDAEMLARARKVIADHPMRLDAESGPPALLRGAEPMLIDNPVGSDDSRTSTAVKVLDIGSIMMLPLRLGDGVIGTLHLSNSRGRRRFTSFDLELGMKLAERIAPAIENSRRASDRAAIASTLQSSLRPAPIPDIEGWRMSTMYRPAGAENEVGGDFYGAYRVDEGWLLVMGDVTGRGAKAASITGLVRQTLKAASLLSNDPLVALDTVNRALVDRPDLSLCTLVAIAIDDNADQLRIAAAGHPAPLRIRDRTVEEIRASGPVLGAFPDAEWELSAVELEPQEQLVVYTDGVTETANGGGRFGEDRLREVLAGAPSPDSAVRRVETALVAFRSRELDDDVAMLAMQPAKAVRPA